MKRHVFCSGIKDYASCGFGMGNCESATIRERRKTITTSEQFTTSYDQSFTASQFKRQGRARGLFFASALVRPIFRFRDSRYLHFVVSRTVGNVERWNRLHRASAWFSKQAISRTIGCGIEKSAQHSRRDCFRLGQFGLPGKNRTANQTGRRRLFKGRAAQIRLQHGQDCAKLCAWNCRLQPNPIACHIKPTRWQRKMNRR